MKPTRRAVLAGAATTAAAATIAACGGSDSGDADGKITLTVATFNEFGYEDLYKQYMEENPNITIKASKAATADEARQTFMTSLAAGKGVADVQGVEVGWWAELLQYADKFEDLQTDEVEGRWLEWKTKAATVEGKLLGYGTDIGPEAIAYRADLFAKAGLPSDREEVAALLQGDWDTYFEVGKQFVAAAGIPWFDGAGGTYNGMVQQLSNPYESNDGTPIPLDKNPDVKAIYDKLVEHKDLSAGLGQWSEDWTAAFQNDGFATMLCPAWMTGPIEGNAEGVTGWDIANVFPGGGGNWGGSYLAVPSAGKNVEEAKKLAAWLTAPEQAIGAFKAKGAFPSQNDALSSAEVTGLTNEFFNNAPVGSIFSDRATAITTQPFVGPKFYVINTCVADAITRWDVDKGDPVDSWNQAITAYNELGLS